MNDHNIDFSLPANTQPGATQHGPSGLPAPAGTPGLPHGPASTDARDEVGMSAVERHTMLANALQRGIISRAEFDASVAELGAQPAAPPSEVDTYLSEVGFKPGAPSEYRLPVLDADGKADSGQLAAAAGEIREVLTASKLPAGVGSWLAEEVARTYERTKDAGQHELTIRQRAVLEELSQVWGPDFNDNLDLLDRFFDELDSVRPGSFDYMVSRNGHLSAALWIQLAHHAGRLAMRPGARPGRLLR